MLVGRTQGRGGLSFPRFLCHRISKDSFALTEFNFLRGVVRGVPAVVFWGQRGAVRIILAVPLPRGISGGAVGRGESASFGVTRSSLEVASARHTSSANQVHRDHTLSTSGEGVCTSPPHFFL